MTNHDPNDTRLRAALDGFAPEARPGFREELRARFTVPARPSLEDALAGPPPAARPEFKASLRERFVEVERPVDQQGGAPPQSQSQPQSQSPVPRRLAPALALAAAAALLLWFFWPASAPVPRFVVHDATFVADGLEVDGAPVAAGLTAAQLAERLEGAARLRFLVDRQVLVELDPGSELDVSGLVTGAYVLRVGTQPGAFRVATTPGFEASGSRLTFHTAVRDVEVVGTVFGVDVLGPDTVCICCLEGEVVTTCPAGVAPTAALTQETTLVLDGGAMEHRTNMDLHLVPLRALSEFCSAWGAAQSP